MKIEKEKEFSDYLRSTIDVDARVRSQVNYRMLIKDPVLRATYDNFNILHQSLSSLFVFNLSLTLFCIPIVFLATYQLFHSTTRWDSLNSIATIALFAGVDVASWIVYLQLNTISEHNNGRLPLESRIFLEKFQMIVYGTLNLVACYRIIARSVYGVCEASGHMMGVWNCNPFSIVGGIPIDSSMIAMLLPILYSVSVRGGRYASMSSRSREHSEKVFHCSDSSRTIVFRRSESDQLLAADEGFLDKELERSASIVTTISPYLDSAAVLSCSLMTMQSSGIDLDEMPKKVSATSMKGTMPSHTQQSSAPSASSTSPSKQDSASSQSVSTSSRPSIPSATSFPWWLSTFPASSIVSTHSYHGFQALFSFVTRKMDIVIDRDFMLSLLCSRYHLQVRDVLIKKYEVNEARKCQSGYGFLFIDRLEDAKIVIKNLQGLCLEGINFDCQLSNRSLEKINAVRRAAGLDEEGRREGEAEQRGSRGPEDGSSLPPSTTLSGSSPSNSRRDLSSSSTSTIYASTSSEEYSSYDSHDSHSRFIENRSYGTASAPTMSLRHLVQETLAPARYYSSHASSAVSAASLQPAIPYYHGSLPRRFQAAGPSTASTMISASLPTAAGMVAAALPSNGMRPNLLRVGTVAPTPASQQMMMMMPQTMAVNGLQVQGMVIFPPSYGNNH
eukprot:gene11124-12392_t